MALNCQFYCTIHDTMTHIENRNIVFEKYHGAGNDFIMIKDMDNTIRLSTEEITFLCNRRLGVGADGMIIVRNDADMDYRMHYYNADGRESTMCGNGGRCVAAFAYNQKISGINQRFNGPDGAHSARINSHNGSEFSITLKLNDVEAINSGQGFFTLNTGSPHYISFTHSIDTMDVKSQGRKIRFSSQFAPDGLNVNFVEEKNGKLYVRTYERGVEDETLSCGTGVTAAALAWAKQKNLVTGTIPIITRGGEMQVSFRNDNNIFSSIFLSGPAIRVFEGSFDI